MYVFKLFDKADSANPLDARMLREGSLRIGRDPGCDWVIVDPDCEISRSHCELHAGPAGVSVRSTGANGVYDAENARLPDGCDVPISVPGAIRFGKFRMVAEHAPDTAFGAGGDGRTQIFTPPLGTSVAVPSDWADAGPEMVYEEGSLLEAFCQGAGLDASVFSTEEPGEVMRRAGAVYRQMVLGVGDLMAERERTRAGYRLAHTTIGGSGNNPFKWAPTQRLAIDLLLAGESSFLSGPAALKASFEDIKKHLVATFAGFRASLRLAIETFGADRIDAAATKRGSLLKSRATAQWEEACVRQTELAGQLDGATDGSLNQAFVKAYNGAAADLDRGDR